MSIMGQREVGAPATASGWMDESGGQQGEEKLLQGESKGSVTPWQGLGSVPLPRVPATTSLVGPWAVTHAGWLLGGLLWPSPVVAGEV